MMKCPPPRLRAVTIIAALLMTLLAGGAYAQFQTGNIYGRVQSKDGSALPGVTVTLTGMAAPRTFITGTGGNFRFLNLEPGSYTLKADLAGLGAATRSGVNVSINQNADVTMTLAPTVAESITVTAEAPLLDVRKTGTGNTVTKIELEKVPTGRDPWVILQQTPGVQLDRINVGGSESGQQSNYTAKGASGSQATWNVDGVNITDVGALGSSPTYYDFDAFEEMQVTTGGSDPRIQTPGVQLNMVTKRGTNDLRGSLRYFNTSGDLQSDPEIPAEAIDPADVRTHAGYLARTNEINNIDDYGAEVGGPIIRDRLWLWGAYSRQQINLFTAQRTEQLTQFPDPFRDNTTLETLNAKLNWEVFANNSFASAFTRGDKIKIGRNVGPERPPETGWNQSGPTDILKLEDTHIFSSNLYLTGLLSRVRGAFQLIGDAGRGCKDLDCNLSGPVTWFDVTGVPHRNYLGYITDRPQDQYRVDASTFLTTGSVNHELKFGFGYRRSNVSSYSAWPGGHYTFMYDTELVPGGSGGVYLSRPSDFDYELKQTDFYAGDTIMFGNLSINAGVRWDSQVGQVLSGSIAANPTIPDILPAISWQGSDLGKLDWSTISPRLGLTYSFGANKKTLLRAAANRYVDQVGGSTIYAVAPGAYQYLYYYFTDVNGNGIAERSEIDLTHLAGFTGVDPKRTKQPIPVYRYDDNMEEPTTDELIFGFESEILTNFSVGANLSFRKYRDFIGFRVEKTQGRGDYPTRADYDLLTTLSGRMPGGGTYSNIPVYELNFTPVFRVITNIPDYEQDYKGLELTVSKRMSNRWMLKGNFTWNDWTQQVGDNAFADPTRLRTAFGCSNCDGGTVVQGSGSGSGAKGGVYVGSEWQYNLTGVYQIPLIETSLGFNVVGHQGYPIPFAHRVFSVNEASYKQVLVQEDAASNRHPDVQSLDLRLAKDFRFANRVGFTLSVDAFNVLNRNTVLQRNTRLGTSIPVIELVRNELYNPVSNANRRGNQITETLSPRVFRLGARFTF